jgi:uncharacterized protein (TIGR02145 family)
MKICYPICMALLAGFLSASVYSCKKESTKKQDNNNNQSVTVDPISFNTALTYGTLTDQDGNTYKTITIGTQTWMAENLRTSKYANGDPIAVFTGITNRPATGTCCVYNNQAAYLPVYGRLYDKEAISNLKGIAPSGWKVPVDADWKALLLYLDPGASVLDGPPPSYNSTVAGEKLKELGISHWTAQNATNETGFTALPGGYRQPDPANNNYTYFWIGYEGRWWSAEGNQLSLASYAEALFYYYEATYASVRLIKIN